MEFRSVNKLISTILCTAVVFAPLAAQAGQVKNRIENQAGRIYQGVKNGSLTRQEYERLENSTEKIEAAQIRAIHSGGKLTKAEKYRLNQRLNRNSRAIYHEKHD
jgi:hypothetical protein